MRADTAKELRVVGFRGKSIEQQMGRRGRKDIFGKKKLRREK